MKYYVDENNSGGRTVVLDCSIDNTGRFQWVEIEADSAEEAISQFEDYFNVDWHYQNSYEGGSCNCCGRRFTLYTTNKSEEDWGIPNIWTYTEPPYFVKGNRGGKLSEAPR